MPQSDPMIMKQSSQNIIFIDGECTFCSRIAQFVIQHEKAPFFQFSTLQTKLGKKVQEEIDIPLYSSVVYLEGEKIHIKSNAVLKIGQRLNTPISLFCTILFGIPRPIRDYLYDKVADKRTIISKKLTCINPESYKDRFIE